MPDNNKRNKKKYPPAKKELPAIIIRDPWLIPYESVIKRRRKHVDGILNAVTSGGNIAHTALLHKYLGLHRLTGGGWVFREWAPNAKAVFFIGEINHWKESENFCLKKTDSGGIWEIIIPESQCWHEMLYRLKIYWNEGSGDRIPSYATRVVQDPVTLIFNAQVWAPAVPYEWKTSFKNDSSPPLIYEVHVGMSLEAEKVGTFGEFVEQVLPVIKDSGYNTLQIMAIQEHPYYGSFGYQVSSFFAVSSRLGTPDEFKFFVDSAHNAGFSVIMDIIHSHAVNNEVEGLSCFDGTLWQYFHNGSRGHHEAWDSRCFDYGKPDVVNFLLSNCRFWLEEFHLDGFRFDGVTSMLYNHHGLGRTFSTYDDYFGDDIDEDALAYLAVANKLIHSLKSDAITIAEDVSGYPGLAASYEDGGIGFDYRFAMGIPDLWIKLTKDIPDDFWDMGTLWYELNNRRSDEKTISYTESHDQALVGDQTLAFRLMGKEMYFHMRKDDHNMIIDRGMALHKMIRLITMATSGNGYLNFMGNEFGHPEWIDFPRAGNNWSYYYSRRQWSLLKDNTLKYKSLTDFDKQMLELAVNFSIYNYSRAELILEHNEDKVLIFRRGPLIFAFNFNPVESYTNYGIYYHSEEPCERIFSTDSCSFGGHDRLPVPYQYPLNRLPSGDSMLFLYLPSRTAQVLTSP